MGYALCRWPLTTAHCFKIAVSRHICKRIWDVWCPNLLFGMPGASTLVSWGTLGRSWETGEHKKGHFEVQAWIFIDLLMNFNSKSYILSCLFPVLFLMFFGSASGCLGLENQAFGKRCIAKTIFRRSRKSHDSRVHCSWFWSPWDQFPWLVLPWRLAWNSMTFWGDSGVIPVPETEPGGR